MKRYIPYFLLLVLALSIQGCQSTSVSQKYDSNIEEVWPVLLNVTHQITGERPVAEDRRTGNITTAWVNGAGGGAKNMVTGKSDEKWRGIITCKPSDTGTVVSVHVEKAIMEESTDGPGGKRESHFGGTFNDPRKDPWQHVFLHEVEAQLAEHKHHHR